MHRRSILFINRVAPPDAGATGRCLADLAGAFAFAGWRVGVLVAGEGPSDLPAGVVVRRVGGRTRGRAFIRLVLAALGAPRHDVVVTMTDPPLLAVIGPLLARLHGCGLVHWSHDLYPDLLPVVGRPLPPWLASLAGALMGRALARHDAVVAIGDCMAGRLAARLPAGRVRVVPNWADPAVREDVDGAERLRGELGVHGRFLVVYAGNFGRAHRLDALVEAAAMLAGDAASPVAFLLVGGGNGRPRIERMVTFRRLGNVVMLPFQPAERVGALLSAADLHVAAMAEAAEGMLVPSKVAGAFAVGRPCLFLGPPASSAAVAVRRWGAGAVLAPDDAAGIAAAVRGFADDRARWAAACAGARCAHRAFAFEGASARFVALADSIVRHRSEPGGGGIGATHA